jgi:hypothetical protein
MTESQHQFGLEPVDFTSGWNVVTHPLDKGLNNLWGSAASLIMLG